jgi:predicted DCC family thiol-disulfide oxidoreductase YuxK
VAAWKLYYDGGCNLCHTSQLRVERWAKRAGQPLDVDVLLSDEGLAKGYGEAMVLEADGKVLQAADAWMKVMTIAPWYLRWLALLAKTKPTMALARFGYGVIAKYRLKWFGSRECKVPARGKQGTGN